jgi:hypothetical protein
MSTPRNLSHAQWRKSSYSDGSGGSCVEIADNYPGVLPVRDSKTPEGPALLFPTRGWAAFVGAVKDGSL